MSIQIIEDQYHKVLYCSTAMIAFGDVFYEDEKPIDFLQWLPQDAQLYSREKLSNKVEEWRNLQKQNPREEK